MNTLTTLPKKEVFQVSDGIERAIEKFDFHQGINSTCNNLFIDNKGKPEELKRALLATQSDIEYFEKAGEVIRYKAYQARGDLYKNTSEELGFTQAKCAEYFGVNLKTVQDYSKASDYFAREKQELTVPINKTLSLKDIVKLETAERKADKIALQNISEEAKAEAKKEKARAYREKAKAKKEAKAKEEADIIDVVETTEEEVVTPKPKVEVAPIKKEIEFTGAKLNKIQSLGANKKELLKAQAALEKAQSTFAKSLKETKALLTKEEFAYVSKQLEGVTL